MTEQSEIDLLREINAKLLAALKEISELEDVHGYDNGAQQIAADAIAAAKVRNVR